jgi:S1-C subfamily serine protease
MARLVTVGLFLIGAILALQAGPVIDRLVYGPAGESRPVVARGDLAAAEETAIGLFEAAQDGVVNITTTTAVQDPFRRNALEVPRGNGTGFFWDARGHVVTNAHVVAGASGATVRLADGRADRARLVGVSRENDLAVLRIETEGPPPSVLPLGRSQDLRVGQSVYAIGNPFGLDFTLTTGIVSALDRELPGQEGAFAITGLVQTDAAINPGNSGGPLLDSAGRLIGVNTAIYSPSGASAGIGFAVPVDTVNRVVPQLIETGRYVPPVIGIRVDPRVDAMAARRGLAGALVLGVDPGSPAAEAGLRPARMTQDGALIPGDRIVAVDGVRVESANAFRGILAQHAAGDTVVLSVRNGGSAREVEVTLVPGTG